MKWCHGWFACFALFPLVFCTLHCHAFEFAGYKSGVSLQDTQARAVQLGDAANSVGSILTINRRIAETDGFDTYLLFFCNNRLYQLNHPEPFSASSFVTLLKNQMDQYGVPEVTSSRLSIGNNNPVTQAEFKWKTASDIISLSINASDGSREELKIAPSMVQLYSDSTIECSKQ
ncbi:hypothetical protein [Herbaspirillum chlorophenolicum]|uniref:hypothetical protein n=1 Tax=Herbaspirillum chlorophenolicum TaxID=211589 RepID=UPI0012E125E4|nr:hypothetical protein [Herbaspirillum chlorophenolicum]